MVKALLDTSVVVAGEVEREIGELPADGALSVISIEELTLGVRMAEGRGDHDLAATRQATIDRVLAAFALLPVDRSVVEHSARIRAAGRLAGRRFAPLDALIAGTAAAHGLPLYTQDAGFTAMEGVDVRLV